MNERRRDFWTAIGFVVVCAAGVVAIVYALGCGVMDPAWAPGVQAALGTIQSSQASIESDVASVVGLADTVKGSGLLLGAFGFGNVTGGGGTIVTQRLRRGGTGNGTE